MLITFPSSSVSESFGISISLNGDVREMERFVLFMAFVTVSLIIVYTMCFVKVDLFASITFQRANGKSVMESRSSYVR